MDFIEAERQAYYHRLVLLSRIPGKYFSFIIDGADQRAYELPHFTHNMKYDKEVKLKVKLIGELEDVASKSVPIFKITKEH